MKKLALSVVIATSFLFNVANADILKSNETIPVVHQVIVSKTVKIELSGNEKKEFVYAGKLADYSTFFELDDMTADHKEYEPTFVNGKLLIGGF